MRVCTQVRMRACAHLRQGWFGLENEQAQRGCPENGTRHIELHKEAVEDAAKPIQRSESNEWDSS